MLPEFYEIEKQLTGKYSLKELEARLRSGKCGSDNKIWKNMSSAGFITSDESLIEVVKKDYEFLKDMSIDYKQMAEMAEKILKQAWSNNKTTKIDRLLQNIGLKKLNCEEVYDPSKFDVILPPSFGSQSCPWGCEGTDEFGYKTHGSGHIFVHKKNHEEDEDRIITLQNQFGDMNGLYLYYNETSAVTITALTPHLIAEHHFFQGNTCYRTDPQKLLEFVECKH